MKPIAILFLISVLLAGVINAQDTSHSRIKLFRLTIRKTDGKVQKGYFYAVSDSTVSLLRYSTSRRSWKSIHSIPAEDINEFIASTINEISVQKKGRAGRGILIGGISGAVLGGAIGALTYKEDPDAFLDLGAIFNGLIGVNIGLIGGAIVGGIIGGAKKEFFIGGEKETLKLIRPELQTYTIRRE